MDDKPKGFRPRPDNVTKYFPRGLRTKEVQPTALKKTTVLNGHSTGVVASTRQASQDAHHGQTVADKMQRRLEIWKAKHSNADKVRRRALPPRRLSNTNIYFMP